MPKLAEWYHVDFDENNIYRRVEPPERAAWSDQLGWNDIERVCFAAGDLFDSDELWFFLTGRESGYVIPTEADGGKALVNEVLRRNLIPAMLMIQAASSVDKLFCWPPVEPSKEQSEETPAAPDD